MKINFTIVIEAALRQEAERVVQNIVLSVEPDVVTIAPEYRAAFLAGFGDAKFKIQEAIDRAFEERSGLA